MCTGGGRLAKQTQKATDTRMDLVQKGMGAMGPGATHHPGALVSLHPRGAPVKASCSWEMQTCAGRDTG